MLVSGADSRVLLLDGQPYLMRGVAYSPTPVGIDPEDQSLDFFHDDYQAIYDRDLPLMAAAGVNTLRVYVMDDAKNHVDFLDKCVANNITIVGGYEMHVDEDHPFNTEWGFRQVKLDLQRQVNALAHPAITMWFVGNELNLPTVGFMCDPSDGGNTTCLFDGTDMMLFLSLIDELCAVVVDAGMLCSTPLAEYRVPPSYYQDIGSQDTEEGSNAWFKIMENTMPHVAINTVNLYKPGGFGDWFYAYRGSSTKPVAITEYGVDAFQTYTDQSFGDCEVPPAAECLYMAENQTSHALMVQKLTENIERNTVTCLRNCDTNVLTGGIIMSWADEWHKGHGPVSSPTVGPWGTEWWFNEYEKPDGLCPDWSATVHSPCAFVLPNGLDDWWNEEWFGLFSVLPGCTDTDDGRRLEEEEEELVVDRLTARTAYYYLQAMWTKGSCTPQDAPLGGTPFNRTAFDLEQANYPDCDAEMKYYRSMSYRPAGVDSDCDYQNFVHQLNGRCPPVPAHYTVSADDPYLAVSLDEEMEDNRLPAAATCVSTVTPTEELLSEFQCDNTTTTDVQGVEALKYRLQRVWGTYIITLDCKPWMMRGISYSPVPWEHDPSYHEPYGDYFTDEYHDIVKRDLALFQEMGANTVRLYSWRLKTRHMKFLDLADELGLLVSSAYEMGTAEDTPIFTYQEKAIALARLQRRLQVSKHRAIVMWMVGNELNGAWQEYVCEDSYAEKFLHMPCIFGDNATRLCEFIDQMCEVVHSEGGWMCSTPFAGVNPPSKYTWGTAPYSAHGWIQVCEGKKPLPEEPNPYAVRHVDFWAANLYPGKRFDGFNFSLYSQISDLPLLVTEYGIDAYNVNEIVPSKVAADPRDIGDEDDAMQSDWLMNLVEDLERHSSACTLGCEPDESRVALGGSIMAWSDEWWKGRVIESVSYDNRTNAMADLCPDPYSTVHSGCGYPSAAQPDTYVNEEWFGLFAIETAQCRDDGNGPVDQYRARDAWFRLKLLWAKGSCLGFYGMNQTLSPYNTSEYPECSAEMTRLRGEMEFCFQAFTQWEGREEYCTSLEETNCGWDCYNARLECSYWQETAESKACDAWRDFEWDGSDCAIMKLIIDGRCPLVPDHMRDLNETLTYEKAAWVMRPETCDSSFARWWNRNGGTVVLLSLLALTLLIVNARRIGKMLREWAPHSNVCAALSKRLRKKFGLRRNRPGQWLANFNKDAAQQEAGLRNAAPQEEATSLAGPLSRIMRPPCAPGYLPADARRARNARVHALLLPIADQLASCFGLQKTQTDFFLGYGLEDVPSNLSNQVEHLVALLSQRFDRMKGGGLDFAPALRQAVAEVHDALFDTYFKWMAHIKLRARTTTRGSKVTIGSYTYRATDFHSANLKQADAGAQWVCNAQLHRCVLYLMIWGEAANLRHMPECLCYIFYCASNSLLLTHPHYANGKGDNTRHEKPPTSDSPGPVAQPPENFPMADENEFLEKVVRPIYLFLKYEVLVRKDEPISQRVMYDDVNEAFWNRRLVHSLLPDVSDSQQRVITAYAHLRDSVLAAKEGGVAYEKATHAALKKYFVKTYAEKISWWHLFATYYRVFIFNAVGVHFMIAIALRQHYIEQMSDAELAASPFSSPIHWYYLSTFVISHACVMVAVNMVACWVSPRRRWWIAALRILGYLAVVACFVVENFVCGIGWQFWGFDGEPPDTCANMSAYLLGGESELYETGSGDGGSVEGSGDNSGGAPLSPTAAARAVELILDAKLLEWIGMSTFFEAVAAVYAAWHLMLLLSLVGVASRISYFRSYVGSKKAVSGISTNTLTYSAFWLIVIAIKFTFEYLAVIKPMISPSIALWNFEIPLGSTNPVGPTNFYCWDLNWNGVPCSYTGADGKGFGDAFPEFGIDEESAADYLHALRTLRSYYYRIMFLALRWATPLLLCFADTTILYSLVASIFSFLLASYRRVYHAYSWAATVRNIPVSVMQFNTKVLAECSVALLEHGPEWYLEDGIQKEVPSLEACSTQWHSFGTAWNGIVVALRQSDLLSNSEQAELLFEPMHDPQCREAFGVDSYVLFPTMITSPVFSRALWEQRVSSYPSVLRTLIQTRDVVWYLLVQLNLVGDRDQPPEPGMRRQFLRVVTRLAELEAAERRARRMGDAGPLLALLDAFKLFIIKLADIVKELTAAEKAGRADISDIDAGPDGPAAKIVTELEKFIDLLMVSGDEDNGEDATAGLSPGGLRTHLGKVADATKGGGSKDANGGRRGSMRLGRRGSAAMLLTPKKTAKKVSARQRDRASLTTALRGLLVLEPQRVADNLHRVIMQPEALNSLHRALTTINRGCEPDNAEAIRQLVYFANSLHNRRLRKPPPVPQMKSWTCFTPHYQEEVTYSMESLHATTENNASLLTILKSLHPDEWANLTQRINLVERHGRRDVDEHGDIVAATDDVQSATVSTKLRDTVSVGHARRLSTTNNPDMIACSATKASKSMPAPIKEQRRGSVPSVPSSRSVGFASLRSSLASDGGSSCSEGADEHGESLIEETENSRFMREHSKSVQQQMETEQMENEVQRWASDRSQVLSRTVRGMMRYGEALSVLAELEGVPPEDVAEWVDSKFEYVVACQMYHRLKTSTVLEERDKAFYIDELRHKYPSRMKVAYVEVDGQGSGASFASVLLGVDPEREGVDRILYKVKLPGNPILGEGKPENQNHAVVFTRGEHLQTLDMNQDNYMGESYKMRNLLEYFKGKVRIVGFREHIFSWSGGIVAHFAASNEFVFGTMVQRFLTWPLGVRFHYGHPDVWDKVWALSSGGLSKASRTLHVSEDIFGGLNVVLRGGSVEYEEYIHCGKARDITFAASNSFEQKISGGNAFQAMSRDFHRAAKNFDLFRLLSMYHTGSGQFATSAIMFWALHWFILAMLALAMVGLETVTVNDGEAYFDLTGGGKTQVYAAEWFVQLGFVLIIPLFLEYTGSLGMLRAMKEILQQLLGFKFLFTLFQERTRAFYLHQGLILGSARYIATGRGYTMSSNFLLLYDRYARSHFYCAFELFFLCLMYFTFSVSGAIQLLSNTYPVMLIVLALWLSPWIFNPHSFQASTILVYLEEFLNWLDSERDGAEQSGWQQWHTLHFRSQRNALTSRKILLFFGQKFVPKLVIFTSATMAMRIDPLGDGRTKLNYAMFRSWISLSAAIIYLVLGAGYMKLAHLNFLRQLFGRRHYLHLLYLWGLRTLMLCGYVWIVWTFFDEYLNTSREEDWRPEFGIPYERNTAIILAIGINMHILLVQTLSFLPDPSDRNAKGKKRGGPLSAALVGYCDMWYRELDLVLGQLLVAILLVLSLFPIAFFQTRVLFNSVYAGALDTMAARRHLVLYVYSQINLAGLLRLLKFLFVSSVEFLGWVLGLFGLRRCATALLKRTWCWPKNRGEAGYNVLFDTASGRFVPTESLAARPMSSIESGPLSADFLSKLGGPGADLTELGLRQVEDLSLNELRACIAAAGMDASLAGHNRAALESIAREALSRTSLMSRCQSADDRRGFDSGASTSADSTLPADLPPPPGEPAGGLLPEGAQSHSELPEGWREAVDLASGRTYFFHAKLQQTSWVRPVAKESEWVEAVDPISGRTYFVNRETGVRTWTRPEGMPTAAPDAAGPGAAAKSSELAAASLAAVNAPRHRRAAVNRAKPRGQDTHARAQPKSAAPPGRAGPLAHLSSRASAGPLAHLSSRASAMRDGSTADARASTLRESCSNIRDSMRGSFVGSIADGEDSFVRRRPASCARESSVGVDQAAAVQLRDSFARDSFVGDEPAGRGRTRSHSNAGPLPQMAGGAGVGLASSSGKRCSVSSRAQQRESAILVKIREQAEVDASRMRRAAQNDLDLLGEREDAVETEALLDAAQQQDLQGFVLNSEGGELRRTSTVLPASMRRGSSYELLDTSDEPRYAGTPTGIRLSQVGVRRMSAAGVRSSFARRTIGGNLLPFPQRASCVSSQENDPLSKLQDTSFSQSFASGTGGCAAEPELSADSPSVHDDAKRKRDKDFVVDNPTEVLERPSQFLGGSNSRLSVSGSLARVGSTVGTEASETKYPMWKRVFNDDPPPPPADTVDSWLKQQQQESAMSLGRDESFSVSSRREDEQQEIELPDRGVPADIRDALSISLGIRQSQLRRINGRIAYHLASVFGFQLQHPHGDDDMPVLSSVANQVEHLTGLLASRMDTYGSELTFMEALRASVASLHQKVFQNWINWVNHVGLPSRVMQRGYISLGSYDVSIWEFQCSEEANAWLCNAQLHRLLLFFLMHGEAANLRHLPECLCFIFYGMANTLLLTDTTGYLEPSEEDFPLVAHFHAGSSVLNAPGYPALDFLTSIVTPVYEFIKHEVFTRREEDVHTRAMYDDITECFWQRPQIARMLPSAYGRHMDREKGGQDLEAVSLKAYAHFRDLMLKATKKEGGAKLGLREYFGKTYYEKQGWAHCFHVFGRIFMWHNVAFHALLSATFGNTSSFTDTWKSVSTVCITHACFKIIRQLVDAHIGHPPRSAFSRVPSFRGGDKQSYTEHVVIILGFAIIPLCYLVEARWRPTESAHIYHMVSVAYAATFLGSGLVHTKPGHRVRSLWRKKHMQHIGNQEQMAVPFDTWLTYTLFWCVVLTIKSLFAWYELVKPLKKPLEGLVYHPFPNIEVEYCELNFQLTHGNQADDGYLTPMSEDAWLDKMLKLGYTADYAAERFCAEVGWCLSRCSFYEMIMRLLLLALRCSVPWLVFQFDTYIWFNVCSACCSCLLAMRRKIGVISQWKHLVKEFHTVVHHFNVKLLGTNNGNSAAAAAAAAASGKADWSVEARSAEWQCFGTAWNEIVSSLRFNDQMSNVERDELLFGFISGTDCEDFFGVPEYVLFPTMLTSPVFTATVWQQGKRAYPSFERTLLQTRDLMVWLCVKLGLIGMEQREELMRVLTGLGGLQAKLTRSKRSGAAEVLRLRSSVVALVEHLQAVQKAPLPLQGSQAEAELAEGIADQVHLLMQRVKGLYTDGVDKDTLAIPLDGVTRECANMWRRLQDLVKPETLLESAASSALANLHDETAEAVLGALGRSMTTSNPGGEPQNGEAKRQILFFANSLFNTTMTKPPPVTRMKSWSAFTPHYGEDVTYSMAQLRGEDSAGKGADDKREGVNLQNLLISLFPDEWENFCERIGVLTMVTQLPKTGEKALQRWASDRSQLLSRTVRGMMRYAEGLRVLARLEGVPEEEIEMVVASKYEYLLTCQIYGKLRAAPAGTKDAWMADGIDELRQHFSRNLRVAYVDMKNFSSVLLGIDPITGEDRVLYKVKLPGNPILGEGKPENQNHAIIFTRGEHLQTLDMNQDNYMGESYKMRNLLEHFQGRVRIVGFREHIFSESGGAVANFAANNEFVFGTLVQRFLTWPLCVRFHYGHPDVWDKTWAFSSGGVSKASRTLHVSEDIFAGFNTVLRGGGVEYLEYIHCGKGRDMFFTAINGFEQKISAGNALQCTSRDLYRLGKYFDIFRLLSFYCSGSGFYMTTMFTIWAVYLFSVAQLVIALCGAEVFEFNWYASERPDLVDDGSSSGGGGGHRMLMARMTQEVYDPRDTSVALSSNTTIASGFVNVNVYQPHEFALADPSLANVNGTDNAVVGEGVGMIYGSFTILQLGFAMMIPYGMEVAVETSLGNAVVKLLTTFFGLSWIFSLFAMQTKGFNFSNAITFGRASYVATGRGYQVDTASICELYSRYAQSHIYLAAEMALFLVIFQLITANTDQKQVALSVWAGYLASIALALSPWIFNPQALTYPSVAAGMREWVKWLSDVEASSTTKAASTWIKWHTDRMKMVREATATTRCMVLVFNILLPKLVLLLACLARLRRGSSRPLGVHVLLMLLSATLTLALSFINLALHALCERIDHADDSLEFVRERLPDWLKRPQDKGGGGGGGGGGHDRPKERERDSTRSETPSAADGARGGASLCRELFLLVRRVLWLALFYLRFSLIYIWYFVVIKAWEQYCWSASCTTTVHTSCRIEASTFWEGLPTWWCFALYSWSRPTTYSAFLDKDRMAPSNTAVHDLLLSCQNTSAVRTCERACYEFPPAGDDPAGGNQFACVRASAFANCTLDLDSDGLYPINECTSNAVAAYSEPRPAFDHTSCWNDMPGMYIMAITALVVLSVCVQIAGIAPTPKKDSPWVQPMSAVRTWADHYYRLGDRVVGLGVVLSLWGLTILPLNYVQSILLFKRNFYQVIARRTHKADLLDRLVS